jgi:mono/diheme cytochrome c family protein
VNKRTAVASAALTFGGVILAGYAYVSGAQPSAAPAGSPAGVKAVLTEYCAACHNSRSKTAGLDLESLDVARVGDHADVWEKVATKVRTHEMPPPGRPRPDSATYAAVRTYLERALDEAAGAAPNPGYVPIHRLNRAEYANAIRDLLDLKIDGATFLVADEPDKQGFENIAGLLTVSPVRLERYLAAARRISRLAIGDATLKPVVETYSIHPGLTQDDRVSEDLPFGTQGGIAIDHLFPVDAEYTIKVLLKRQVYLYIIGMGEAHQLDVRIDGVRVKRFSVGGEGKGMTAPESYAGNTQGDPGWEEYMHNADAHLEVRVPVKAGRRKVGISFIRQYWEREGILSPNQTGYAVVTNENYFDNPSVESVLIGGPYGAGSQATGTDTPTRRKVFTCRPKNRAEEEPCARQVLSTLATRAYRRPATKEDIETLLGFYRSGYEAGGFEAGIQRGLERILAAPSFLFRVERQVPDASASTYRLSSLELASRLSFFIWSSIPDDELIALAAKDRLRDPAVMEQQVKRMLADPRASALVDTFAVQWLNLGKIAGAKPDEYEFPEFDENLRSAMLEETRRFIGSQIREDRSVVDLVRADYSFVNDRLARHYGIPDVFGNQFRRMAFTDGVRGGLLGQASILTVTSYPNRTSPVVRGKWLLENLLGAPPPPPPPDVPALTENTREAQPKSVRERLEMHRRNPTCAACHVRMDPLGFSLENFDGLGKWRTTSDGVRIDAAASLPDGTAFEGVAGLRKLVIDHQDEFVRTLTEKLLSYALGRGLEYFDMPAVRQITSDARSRDTRWSALVLGIVRSTPFTMGTVTGNASAAQPEPRNAEAARRSVR